MPTDEITINKGLGKNLELTLFNKPPVPGIQEEIAEIINIGAPNLRTNWTVNSIALQNQPEISVVEAAAQILRKAVILLEVDILYDNTPTVLTVFQHTFKENSEVNELPEKTDILEPITPFKIQGGHSLSIQFKLKRGKPNFLGIKTTYIWNLINPKITAFITQDAPT